MPFKIQASFSVLHIDTPNRRFPSFLVLLYTLISIFSPLLVPVVLVKWLLDASLLLSPPFCSLWELVVTSLRTDLGWWSGAGGWRMLWGKSFSFKPMRWSSISKNWATFKFIHSWRSIWHLCWWRCWNELIYLTIFHAPFVLTSSLTSSSTCKWKEHHNSNTEIEECFFPHQTFLVSLCMEAGEGLRPETLNLPRRLRPYRSLNMCIWVLFQHHSSQRW